MGCDGGKGGSRREQTWYGDTSWGKGFSVGLPAILTLHFAEAVLQGVERAGKLAWTADEHWPLAACTP